MPSSVQYQTKISMESHWRCCNYRRKFGRILKKSKRQTSWRKYKEWTSSLPYENDYMITVVCGRPNCDHVDCGDTFITFLLCSPWKMYGKRHNLYSGRLTFFSQQQVPMLFIRNPRLWCVLIRVVENSWESIWQSWNCLKHWASKTTERSPAKLVCMYNFSQAVENVENNAEKWW